MRRLNRALIAAFCLPLAAAFPAPDAAAETSVPAHPGSDEFIRAAVQQHGLDPSEVAALLETAEFQQRVADLIARPAESKPWYEYRPIFMTDQRLEAYHQTHSQQFTIPSNTKQNKR